jgi:hypothetical protein
LQPRLLSWKLEACCSLENPCLLGACLADFDPYYVWLGIPPKHQPADHYRLLGLERFESDPRVIESAADRQMAHVKTFQTGKNSADSQQVLNHLAQARNCLLSPQKTDYDRRLRESAGEPDFPLPPPVKRMPPPVHGLEPLASLARPPAPYVAPRPFLAPASPPPSATAPVISAAQEPPPAFPWPGVLAALGLTMVVLVFLVGGAFLIPWLTKPEPKTAQRVSPKNPLFEPDRSPPSRPLNNPFRLDKPPNREDFDKLPKPDIPIVGPSDPSPTPFVPSAVPTVPTQPPVAEEGTIARTVVRNLATPPSDAPVPAGPPISLLEKLPPQPLMAGGNVAGKWEIVDGQLVGKDGGFMLPGEVPRDYQLDLTVEHMANTGFFVIGIVVDGHQTAVVIDWETGGNFVTGFHGLDSQSADRNDSTYRGEVFPADRPCRLRCVVRGNYVQVTADEKPLIQWRGDPARLILSRDWAVPDGKSLFISSSLNFRISRIELTPFVSAPLPAKLQPKFVLGADRRLPPPTGKNLQQARTAARKLFTKEFSNLASVVARRTLAQTLITRMREDRDEMTLRFALLQEASDLARNASDPLLACDAIELQSRNFEIDALALQTALLEGMAKDYKGSTAPADLRNTAHATSIYLDRTLVAERLELSARLAALLTRLATLERSAELKDYATRRRSEVAFAKQLYDAMTPLRDEIGEDAKSAQANLEVGRYECFVRGNWTEGLLLLSHGSDKELAEVASLELVADVRKCRPLADAWWKLAESVEEPWQTQFRQQAKYWYEKVAEELTGLERQSKIANVKGTARTRLVPGLVGTYYQGDNREILRAARIEKRLFFPWGWGEGSPDSRTISRDHFSATWSGYIEAPIPGKYRLIVDSDDGSRLTLDGRILWDLYAGGAGARGAEVELTGQPQRLEIHFHEGEGVTRCELRSELVGWARNDGPGERVVDEVSLRHDPLAVRELRVTDVAGFYPELTTVPSSPEGGLFALFEDQTEFPMVLTEGGGLAAMETNDRYSGDSSLRIVEDQRFRSGIPGVRARVREKPGPGEYRYLRLAWKKSGGAVIGFQMLTQSKLQAKDTFFEWRRYHIGPTPTFPLGGASIRVGEELPTDWSVITRDLFADYGEFDLTGVALSPCDGLYGLFDHIYLARQLEDFDRLGIPVESDASTSK